MRTSARKPPLADVLADLKHALHIAQLLAESEPAEARRLLRAAARDAIRDS